MSDEASLTSTSSPASLALFSFSPATRDFLAGLGAGVASVVIGQPLDTLRVHEQAAATAAAGTAAKSPPSAATLGGGAGPLATARRLLSSSSGGGGGGPRAFWRGVAYPAATIGFQSAIVFQAYGIGCRFLAEREEEERRASSSSASSALPPPPLSTASSPSSSSSSSSSAAAAAPLSYSSVFLAGTVSGAAQLAVIVPVDLLKIRAQLSPFAASQKNRSGAPALASAAAAARPSPLTSFLSPLTSAVSSAWRDGGGSVRGLYRGGLVTALRDVPSHGVYFACYELCRELLDPGSRSGRSGGGGGAGGAGDSKSSSSSSLALLAAGGIAGAASWLSVYPLDVIKTRVQAATLLGGGSVAGGGSGRTLATTTATTTMAAAPLPSAMTALRDAVRAGGLWNGLSSTLVSLRRGVNEFSPLLSFERGDSKRPRNEKNIKNKTRKTPKNLKKTGPRLRRQRGPVLLLRVPDRAHGREGPGGRRRRFRRFLGGGRSSPRGGGGSGRGFAALKTKTESFFLFPSPLVPSIDKKSSAS